MPSLWDKEHPVLMSKDFGKMTKHGSSSYGKPEKAGDMYVLKWAGKNEQSDIQKGIEQVLGPLSLFAPYSYEDVATSSVDQIHLERPVTPIDEEIKFQPKTIDKIAQLIRRRIMAKPNVPYLSLEDQKNLAAVIMGEVNGIWPDIRRQIDDPFLTPAENKELNRRIAVYIVTVCDQLFHHYLDKAQVLNSRGVFSGPANMSRLKVQLALEASGLLNILKIRRHIVRDIRKSAATQEDEKVVSPGSALSAVSSETLTYKDKDSNYSRTRHQKITLVEQEIKEIQNGLPELDTRQLMEFVANLPRRDFHSAIEAELQIHPNHVSQGALRMSGVCKEEKAEQNIALKRSNSQPLIEQSGNLLEELGIDSSVKVDRLIKQELQILQREKAGMTRVESVHERKLQFGSPNFIEDDLKMLTEPRKDEFPDGNTEDDLPALLQAIIRHAKHDDLKQRMEKKMAELKDNQEKREEEECIYVHGPTYQQPDTVSTKLGNAGVVRTSDIRVSDRVCISTVTLKQQPPVYNDLLDEIDQVSVKDMDTNLFLTDEIREVYKEIMKTVPTTHLELDNEPFIMNAPDFIDLTGTTASATLSRQVMDRIINPVFRRDRRPPQKDIVMKGQTRISYTAPKNIQRENLFAGLTKNTAKFQGSGTDFRQMLQREKMSGTQALQQQQKMFMMTSDDYLKYLSALETDFLGAVFHLYDSEKDGDSEDDETANSLHPFSRRTRSSKVNAEQKEKIQKIEELRKLKSEYKDGFWNANSVLLGGLGKDPELADESSEEKKHGGRASASSESARKSPERASQLRMVSGKRDQTSRMSKTTAGTSELASSIAAGGNPQDRLESVWEQLQMPDSQRLDMAIKYSCNDYFSKLIEAVEKWELITELILRREGLLAKLEKFEREASDPNRFFAKGSKNSTYRLEESRQRTYIYKQIDALDTDIKTELEYVKDQFQDVITFKGRPYIDKMKWDRTEMLYWLSEERKQNGLRYEAVIRGLNMPIRPTHLQAIVHQKHQ